MKRYLVLSAAVLPVIVLSLASGCVTPDPEHRLNLLSTEEEIQLGEKMSAEVEKSEKTLNNAAIQTYVRKIGERLADQSPRQDVPYAFTVIDNPEVVNAFALPGGHMYIYTGLMKICDNEAQLASVMAHEIGHVAAKHHGETLTRQMGYQVLADLILGPSSPQRQRALAQLATNAVAMHFSRDQEHESDRIGMDILFRAGYKPEAMVDFMRKMAQYEQENGGGRQPRFLQFFASHPATTDRIANLDALVQRYPLDLRNQSPTYFDRYKANVLDVLR
ncbi:MAG: M48 family metalloprotease [Candidatus Hydrogenedentes bacterium]|nr:M48 family metalloprotease [Candidatus Hydrogenedentota bacterium]